MPPAYWEDFKGYTPPAPGPDLTQPCKSATTHPLCAFKTWAACITYDQPQLCAAVGLAGSVARHEKPSTLDQKLLTEPWLLPLDQILPDAFAFQLFNGGIPHKDRFAIISYSARPLEADVQKKILAVRDGGISELIVDIPELDFTTGLIQMSFFFRNDADKWVIVGWHSSRNGACAPPLAPGNWRPCDLHIRDLALRDTATGTHTFPVIWASAKPLGNADYSHMGVDFEMPVGESAVAAYSGAIVRRVPLYLDTPAYDWVVLQTTTGPNVTIKYANVDRRGPEVGAAVPAGDSLGRVQESTLEHPGATNTMHFEVFINGQNVDPMTVLPRRPNP